MQNLTAAALAEWLADTSRPAPVLLDVREPWEIQTASIAGAVSIPMREIPARSEELDDDAQILASIAASTLSRVAGRTFSWPLSTRDTVATDTPACSATPAIDRLSDARSDRFPGWPDTPDNAAGAGLDDVLDKWTRFANVIDYILER